MSVAELQELEEIKGLVNRGQQLGVLTYAEIAGAVSELDLDEADVEELHGFLERAEIELVEELDPAIAVGADVERAPAAARRLSQPAQPGGIPDARRAAKRKPAPTAVPELVGTAVQAVGELAEIGLALTARALRNAVSRLPKP